MIARVIEDIEREDKQKEKGKGEEDCREAGGDGAGAIPTKESQSESRQGDAQKYASLQPFSHDVPRGWVSNKGQSRA